MELVTAFLLLLLAVVCILAYIYALHINDFWKRCKVPYVKAAPFLGNLTKLVFLQKNSTEIMVDLYNYEQEKNHPVVGFHLFQTPTLLIRDLDLIKRVFVKDFDSFSNRYVTMSERIDPLGSHVLFFLKNPLWKKLRIKSTPMFTGGKMKSLYPLVSEVGEKLNDHLTNLTKNKAICHEVQDLASLYTADVIASLAFNIDAKSIENPASPFNTITAKVFQFHFLRSVSLLAGFFAPSLSDIMRARFFPEETSTFLRTAIVDVLNDREKTGSYRNDVIDNLIHVRNSMKGKIDDDGLKYDGDALYAQAAQYYTAGYGTTGTTFAFSILELAKNPDCQNRLRKEIHDTLMEFGQKICYDAIMKMEYLHMVINEAMRLYPTLPFLERQCTLPKGETHYSLEPHSEFKIPNGMPVYIPAYPIHRDPRYFPDPDKFNPERFSAENKHKIPDYSFMPFGLGPRKCVGGRLGLLMVKSGLVHLLLNHRVEANEKTVKVVKFEKKAVITQAEGGLYCDIIHDPLFK